MKFTSIVFATLGAGAVLAAPQAARGRQQSRSLQRNIRYGNQAQFTKAPESADAGDSTVYYSDNWSGAVYEAYPTSYATGTIVIPTGALPTNMSGVYADPQTAFWVGIDGVSTWCPGGLLQTGIDITVDLYSGVPSYDAWYEWWPQEPVYLDLVVNAGDTLRMSTYAWTTTSGQILIENLSTFENYQQTFSNMTGNLELCLSSGEWIVEDIFLEGGAYPVVNYTTVEFTDARTNLGNAGNGNPWYMTTPWDGALETTCTADDATVTCTYIDGK